MSLDEIVQRFQAHGFRCVWRRDHWRCQCPAHGGEGLKDLNLSLRVGDKGVILVKCHSHGCTVYDVAPAVGLTVSDFSPHEWRANGQQPPEPEQAWPYRDEQDRVLFQVVRLPGKQFRQRRPEGSGGWKWGLGEARRVLFGLPELLQTEPGDLVAIVEGEKDAVNVASLGLAATTNPMGAGKWRQEYTDWLKEHLTGRRFILLPDNDEPGRKHAIEVYESLKHAGLDVAVAELPELPEKGDVSDWIRAGGTGEALQDLLKPRPHPLDLRVRTGAELEAAELPQPEPLIPHLLYRGFSTLLAGDSKLGKSSLLTRAMLAASSAGWWLDREKRPENRLPQSRLLYINWEDPLFITRDRARKGMDPQRLPDDFLTMEAPYDWTLRNVLDWLHGAHERFGLDAVVLDPIAVAAEWKDETDNSEVGLTYKLLQRLAAETQLAVLTSHHVTKKPGEYGLNIRGGGAIKANVIGYLVLERDKDLFKLSGINKLSGVWDVTLDRRESDWSWWIVESRSGHTRTPQQAAKDLVKADLLAIVRQDPGIVTEACAVVVELTKLTCYRYLKELEAAELIFAHDLPRAEGQEGTVEKGWFPLPEKPDEEGARELISGS